MHTLSMDFKGLLILIFFSKIVICSPINENERKPRSQTLVTTDNSTRKSYIEFGILSKQHHLYIGRCKSGDTKFHGENIILNNNGDNHVDAVILINVEAKVYISCVNIYDQVPNGEGGYPSYIAGGVGHNYIKFGVATNYGKGFNFYVEIYGYYL